MARLFHAVSLTFHVNEQPMFTVRKVVVSGVPLYPSNNWPRAFRGWILLYCKSDFSCQQATHIHHEQYISCGEGKERCAGKLYQFLDASVVDFFSFWGWIYTIHI